MFRGLFLFGIVATFALGMGAQTEALPSPSSVVAGTSAPEEPAAPLTTEKKQLEKDICDTGKARNITALDLDKGPKKVVVTEKKVEEFPENVTKEVTVTKKAEKGPSNETQENTVVERKIVKEVESDTDKPKKNVTIEIESENKICDNKTEPATPVTKPAAEPGEPRQNKHDLETEIEHLKHEEEKVKKDLEKEEARVGKVVPVVETVEVEKEPKEQISCDQCRKELAMLKSLNRKLLVALKKLLMRMTPKMREQTAKIILQEASAQAAATEEKPVIATSVETETPTATKTKQVIVEEKPIVTKEVIEA